MGSKEDTHRRWLRGGLLFVAATPLAGGLEVRPREVREGPHLGTSHVRDAPGGRRERELRHADGDLADVYGLEEEVLGCRHHGEAAEGPDKEENEAVELGGPEDGPRHLGPLDDPLRLQLQPVVGEVRVAVHADDGDKVEVRDAGPARHPEQAFRAFDVDLPRPDRARGAMDHRLDAFHGGLEPLSRRQVSPERVGPAAAAEDPDALPGATQALDHAAPEGTRAPGDQKPRRAHQPGSSSLRSPPLGSAISMP